MDDYVLFMLNSRFKKDDVVEFNVEGEGVKMYNIDCYYR